MGDFICMGELQRRAFKGDLFISIYSILALNSTSLSHTGCCSSTGLRGFLSLSSPSLSLFLRSFISLASRIQAHLSLTRVATVMRREKEREREEEEGRAKYRRDQKREREERRGELDKRERKE
ncbi:hypothetical protein NL108_007148 [Boleophthalmus pectinirostris]|nr:hypothetical protein NL108_007148 [Boleophthalmus pectinirostris]